MLKDGKSWPSISTPVGTLRTQLTAENSSNFWIRPALTLCGSRRRALSNLQNLNMDTEEKREAIEADRDFQEATHLKMCKRGYQKQQREGRRAGIEQPKGAKSWDTRTLSSIQGHDALIDGSMPIWMHPSGRALRRPVYQEANEDSMH